MIQTLNLELFRILIEECLMKSLKRYLSLLRFPTKQANQIQLSKLQKNIKFPQNKTDDDNDNFYKANQTTSQA